MEKYDYYIFELIISMIKFSITYLNYKIVTYKRKPRP